MPVNRAFVAGLVVLGALALVAPASAQAPAPKPDDRVELIMEGRPPAGSAGYKALIRHAGDAKETREVQRQRAAVFAIGTPHRHQHGGRVACHWRCRQGLQLAATAGHTPVAGYHGGIFERDAGRLVKCDGAGGGCGGAAPVEG